MTQPSDVSSAGSPAPTPAQEAEATIREALADARKHWDWPAEVAANLGKIESALASLRASGPTSAPPEIEKLIEKLIRSVHDMRRFQGTDLLHGAQQDYNEARAGLLAAFSHNAPATPSVASGGPTAPILSDDEAERVIWRAQHDSTFGWDKNIGTDTQRDALDNLLASHRALQARVRELEADTKRLDWLEAHDYNATCYNVAEGEDLRWRSPMAPNNGWLIGVYSDDDEEDGHDNPHGDTLRDAIDWAMKLESAAASRTGESETNGHS